MIVHEVKTEGSVTVAPGPKKTRAVFVGSADSDLKYRDLLVYGRHRWIRG